jgi:hypothetical protein
MSAILGLLSDRKLGSLDFQGLYAGNNSNQKNRFHDGILLGGQQKTATGSPA